jgi:hypothetical protein
MLPSDEEIEARIREFFDANLAAIQLERGYSLAPEVKEAAFWQVLLYWRKLREIAERVTDTEVRLNLPEQESPRGRKFGIEGVVDIVRENDRTVMYDVKTYDANVLRANPEACQKQLNVYAYIWRELRAQPLDEMAIISTAFPPSFQDAIRTNDEARLAAELAEWDPVVPIPFDGATIKATIRDFGLVVDQIEEGRFAPAPPEKLQRKVPGRNTIFAVDVCVNCDARFSCSSYLAYAKARGRSRDAEFVDYYGNNDDEADRDWLTPALDDAPGTE